MYVYNKKVVYIYIVIGFCNVEDVNYLFFLVIIGMIFILGKL